MCRKIKFWKTSSKKKDLPTKLYYKIIIIKTLYFFHNNGKGQHMKQNRYSKNNNLYKFIMGWNQNTMEERDYSAIGTEKSRLTFFKKCVQLYLMLHQNQFQMD